MNRREFLKSVTATAIALSAPIVLGSENRWIPFTKEMPKVGQKIAVFTYFKGNSRNILTGRVLSEEEIPIKMHHIGWRGYRYPDDVTLIEACISHSLDGFFPNEDVRTYRLLSRNMGYDSSRKDIERAEWIKGKKFHYIGATMLVPRHGRKRTEYIGRNESYWFPIDEYIPRDLPALPVPKPVNIINENGKKILVKD